MNPFIFDQLAARVVFGAGEVASVGREAARLGLQRVMLVHDGAAQAVADDVAGQLNGGAALRWSEVAQHVPTPLAERARAAATVAGADGVVCIGGGSATGLAKAIALSHRIPILAVPTTYAGSEQTTIYGLTDARHKQTGRDPIVLPRTVIYDPQLTTGLPPAVTGPSAFNALAHSVEALYAPGTNPITVALAMEGVRAIHGSLPRVMARPGDVEARGELQYGAALSGMALGATSAAMHHKICHVLGGMFGLVHADAHSVILAHTVAFLAPALPAQMRRLAAALGAPGGDPAAELGRLAADSQVPTRLADLTGTDGPLRREHLPAAAERVIAELADNPRPVGRADMLALLQRAYDGPPPGTET